MGRPESKTQHCRSVSISLIGERPTTYLARLFANLENVLPQLLRVLDPCFRLEERFSIRAQVQDSAIKTDNTDRCFGFVAQCHNCRMVDFAGVRKGQTSGCWEVDRDTLRIRTNVGALFGRGTEGRRLFGSVDAIIYRNDLLNLLRSFLTQLGRTELEGRL